jgi:hypothetical protein
MKQKIDEMDGILENAGGLLLIIDCWRNPTNSKINEKDVCAFTAEDGILSKF